MAGQPPSPLVDTLPGIRRLLLRWPEMASAFGLPPQIRVVFDTNVIVEDVRFLTARRRDPNARTALQEVLASGVIVGYFPAECLDEVERKLDELSDRYRLSREAMVSTWEAYLGALQIFPTARVKLTEDELDLRDPTDLPFVRLSKLVNASAILSSDRDLSTGRLTVIVPGAIRIELREFARAKTTYLSVIVGETVVVSVALASVVGLIGTAVRLFRAAPGWLQLALTAAVLGVLAHPKWRSAVLGKLRALARAAGPISEAILPVLSTLAEGAVEAEKRSEKLWQSINARILVSEGYSAGNGTRELIRSPAGGRRRLARRRKGCSSMAFRQSASKGRLAAKSSSD